MRFDRSNAVKCSVKQHIFTTCVKERLHHRISTDNVATLANPPRSSTGAPSGLSRRGGRVKAYFNVSTLSIYNILTGQETYIQLYRWLEPRRHMLTGRQEYMSTDGSNIVDVAVEQYHPLLHVFLSTNGVTRTAGVVRRQEGKKLDDFRLGLRSKRCTVPIRSAPSPVRSCWRN